jgi:hypothetical protein
VQGISLGASASQNGSVRVSRRDQSGHEPQLALIREIDAKIDRISAQQRGFMLRHLTDLFLVNEEQYAADEIELIDDHFVRLVQTIEESARALLGAGLRRSPVRRQEFFVCSLPMTRSKSLLRC